jgi:hypothetical protein
MIGQITEKTPSEKHLENWIDQAKSLKIVLKPGPP